jgi:hypothetical protein
MKIINNDSYEEMAAAFQCYQIQALYEVLKQNNISKEQATTICEEFTHSFGVGLDQHWIETEEGKVFPEIAFTKKHLDYNPDELFINNGAFSFSEYSSGDLAWFFKENNPDQEPQIYGTMDEEGNPA